LIFYKTENTDLFARMRIDVVVYNMSFADFMVKLKHLDTGWAK